MRSPVLAFSLFTAAAGSLAAPAGGPIEDNAPSLDKIVARQFTHSPVIAIPRPTASSLVTRQNAGSRPGDRERLDEDQRQQRPPEAPRPPRVPPSPFVSGDDLNGGVAETGAARGQDARSPDSDPATGSSYLNFGNNAPNGGVSRSPNAGPEDDYPYGAGYGYAFNEKRSLGRKSFIRRLYDAASNSFFPFQPINENSNGRGSDGQSIKGDERPGRGPNGGSATSGEPGSSEGGRVYNDPPDDDDDDE